MVKIGAVNWVLRYSKDIDDMGLCNKNDNVISIKPHDNKDEENITILHELIHACYNFIGENESKLEEEEVCTKITPILYTILKENNLIDLSKCQIES